MTDKTPSTTTRPHQLLIDGKPATDAEYARVMNARPKTVLPAPRGALTSSRGFRLLR